jgi:VWFA-related protein
MMRHLALAALLALALLPARPVADRQTATTPCCRVYASVLDDHDAPIADLAAADVAVKEDGKPREIVSVESPTGPLQIVILVDDSGTGIFRFGLNGLMQLLQGKAEISLRVVTGQVQTIVETTADPRAWVDGLARVGVRPATPDGGQLLEGISEAAKDLQRREARRPVIIALTVGGQEQSTLLARPVLDTLHGSRAVLHVLFADSPAVRPVAAAGRASDLLEENFNLSRVLGDGPKQSGGRRRDVLATGAIMQGVQQIARELLAQYAITYARPAGGNAPQKLEVSVKRRGAKVTAPTRAPAR